MTRNQYEQQQRRLAEIKKQLEEFESQMAIDGDNMGMMQNQNFVDGINCISNAIYAIQRAQGTSEDQWMTSDWDASDWMAQSMITQNVD